MNKAMFFLKRRNFLKTLTALSAMPLFHIRPLRSASDNFIYKTIPKSGEQIPAIGMGTWITFNVGSNAALKDHRTSVVKTFFDLGGSLIDSSPMYGSSEAVIGYCLRKLNYPKRLFSATKVWTPLQSFGVAQMEQSEKLWGLNKLKENRFDLLQIHNLLSWQSHLETLQEWKSEGRIRYIGVTTSHGRRHSELEKIMQSEEIDFVQFTYNILDREAEQRLLPMANERKLAVIINRPFQTGALFDRFLHKPLPKWVDEFDCTNWAQFFLKFIISHPAVSCAIPATSRIDHMRENMSACYGELPNSKLRTKMTQYINQI